MGSYMKLYFSATEGIDLRDAYSEVEKGMRGELSRAYEGDTSIPRPKFSPSICPDQIMLRSPDVVGDRVVFSDKRELSLDQITRAAEANGLKVSVAPDTISIP